MVEEIKPIVIKRTQDSLGKFLKRPPLTEKLLKKPPFRFLHDIITAVIRQYGLMEGLFTADEMVSDNVKDKESKIAFLQKVIDTIKLVTGANLLVKPSKIVAGQEADKTNELLQAIAKALDKKLSSKKAVDQVLGKTKEGPSETAKTSSKTKEKEGAVNGKEKTRRKDAKTTVEKKERGKVKDTKESSRKTKEKKSSPEKEVPVVENGVEEMVVLPPPPPAEQELPSLGAPIEELVPSFEPSAPDLTPEPNQSLPSLPEPPAQEVTELGEVTKPSLNSHTPQVTPLTELATQNESVVTPILGSDQPVTFSPEVNSGGSNEMTRAPTAVVTSPAPVTRPASVRPGSARPRPLTARPAAPRLKERLVRPAADDLPPEPVVSSTNIILDSKQDEDDATFIVEETQPTIQDVQEDILKEPILPVTDTGEPQGHLVSQILGTQRELEDQDTKDNTNAEDWKWSGKDVAKKEVARLREAVQGLVRAANPLGRLLDFLQEDVESMQMELEQWQSENLKLRADITREKQATQESLQPLQKELAELLTQVETQKQMNASLKTVVLINDSKLMASLLND